DTGFSSSTISKSNSFMSSSSETSESDDFQPRKNRISLVIKDRSQIKTDDNIQDLRSAVSRLSLRGPLNKNTINKEDELFDGLAKRRSQKWEEEHLGKMRKS